MKNKLTTLLVLFTTGLLHAQQGNDPFDQLIKINPGELQEMGISVQLGPEGMTANDQKITVYDDMGEALSPSDLMSMMQNGKLIDLYKTADGALKAGKLRDMTEAEKKQFEAFASQQGGASPLLHQPAPDFAIEDLDGNSIQLEALRGKHVVLNFWFVNCKPCVIEIPELNHLVERYQDQEVVFLAFALDKNKKLVEFLAEHPFQYTIIPKAQKVVESYGVFGYPTHIVIDPEGIVQYVSSGYGPNSISQLENQIKKQIE